MQITTKVKTVVLINGEELRGDKFHVEYSDGTSETLKNTSAVEVHNWLKSTGKLSDVVYLDEC